MKELIKDFTNQIAHAIVIGNSYSRSEKRRKISNVLISGLGGSGIGGTIAAEVVASAEISVGQAIFIIHALYTVFASINKSKQNFKLSSSYVTFNELLVNHGNI